MPLQAAPPQAPPRSTSPLSSIFFFCFWFIFVECVCVCVHTCGVCSSAHVCEPVCLCMWRLQVSSRNIPPLCVSLVLWGNVSQFNPELGSQSLSLASLLQGSHLSAFGGWDYGKDTVPTWHFHGCWGSKLWFSCFDGWALTTALFPWPSLSGFFTIYFCQWLSSAHYFIGLIKGHMSSYLLF